MGMLTLGAQPAFAKLELCNATASRVGIALGYRDKKGWATEGWWNIASQTCETILRDRLPSQFIYVYAVDYDRGGEWTGKEFMCVSNKSFWIRGAKNCVDRGHQRVGFFEIDTGKSSQWVIRLTAPDGRQGSAE